MPHSEQATPRVSTPDQSALSQYWWNLQVPEKEWTVTCPDFLLNQSPKNIGILSSNEDKFEKVSWKEVQDLAKSNRIHHFHRKPSALRAYLEYIHYLKKTFGSVLAFIQHQRLHWDDIRPSDDRHFRNPADFKVLYNDWPYNIDEDITHLILWTKWEMEDKPGTEEATDEIRNEIEEFIMITFCSTRPDISRAMRRDEITWFKNWKSLKSVHALEHVHLMLYQAPQDLLKAVTAGDRPVSEGWTGSAPLQR